MSVMGQCAFCGRPAQYTCSICGRLVCEEHFDTSTGMCDSCSPSKKRGKERPWMKR